MTDILTDNLALLRHWQEDQRKHDAEFHDDIFNLPLKYRLHHMQQHFSKYAGRLAEEGIKPTARSRKTVVDAALIALSSANTLRLNLQLQAAKARLPMLEDEVGRTLTILNGHFADSLEKMDHLEPGGIELDVAILKIVLWVLGAANLYGIDLDYEIRARRSEIRDSNRNFHLNKRAIA